MAGLFTALLFLVGFFTGFEGFLEALDVPLFDEAETTAAARAIVGARTLSERSLAEVVPLSSGLEEVIPDAEAVDKVEGIFLLLGFGGMDREDIVDDDAEEEAEPDDVTPSEAGAEDGSGTATPSIMSLHWTHLPRMRLCSQIEPPPHSTQTERMRLCLQIEPPLQSLH